MIKAEHFGAPLGRSELDRGLGQRFMQAVGEPGPLALVAINGEKYGERSITAQRENGEVVHLREADVQAAWHGEAWPQPSVKRYSNFLLTRYPQEFADKHHQGYRFVVKSNGMLPHEGFKTADELVAWASLYNLDLPCTPAELETAQLQWAEVGGTYQRATHATTLTFSKLDDSWCIHTRAFDNGTVTAAKRIVDLEAGVVTLHVVGSGCSARQVFDRPAVPDPDDHLYIYVPGERNVLDEAMHVDGQLVGRYDQAHRTLAQFREQYPTAGIYYSTEVAVQIEALCRTEPEEISQERFIDALEVMPPKSWKQFGQEESFKFIEHYSGNITSIYARVGERFFTFLDNASMSHERVMDKIRGSGLLEQPAPVFDEPVAEAPRMG